MQLLHKRPRSVREVIRKVERSRKTVAVRHMETMPAGGNDLHEHRFHGNGSILFKGSDCSRRRQLSSNSVQCRPFLHERSCSPRQAAADNLSAANFHLRLVITICGMKVWRHVIGVIHRDSKTIETAEFGHANNRHLPAPTNYGNLRPVRSIRGPCDIATVAIIPACVRCNTRRPLMQRFIHSLLILREFSRCCLAAGRTSPGAPCRSAAGAQMQKCHGPGGDQGPRGPVRG